LIDTFVNAVYLYDDKIILTFNYKDETQTVKTAEIKNTFRSDIDALGSPICISPAITEVAGLTICPKREPLTNTIGLIPLVLYYWFLVDIAYAMIYNIAV
jgi:hypothetical protein